MTPDDDRLQHLRNSIPPSASDTLLGSWGYSLIDEYLRIIQEASLPSGSDTLELATGSGRMTAVLTRLGYRVLTGDASDERQCQAWQRVTPEFAPLVEMSLLEMEFLPIRDASIDAIVCLNTLHELLQPRKCLSELLRIHNPAGTLILGDFNETGFDVMQRLHQATDRSDHPRGTLRITNVEQIIKRTYSEVRTVVTPLNIIYIASCKK
ncbi:MAG: class I SAM-dependent methyltransferase [Ignavibacteria bacterium]|nr:class I SAM-dependent methyltransferase [Ignavibacteria bacterium]